MGSRGDIGRRLLQPYAPMGELDEAIRDHLELKRKHGAPDDEVAQKERDAFASGALPSERAGGAFEPAVQSAAADTPAPEPAGGAVPDAPPALDEAEPDVVLPEEALEPERHGDTVARSGEPFDQDSVETGGWSEAERTNGRRSDDVLEETPEFLDEGTEQDRFWFEQKPPKDFDLD